jgi:hypothetical protein
MRQAKSRIRVRSSFVAAERGLCRTGNDKRPCVYGPGVESVLSGAKSLERVVGDSWMCLARYKLPRNRLEEIGARTTFSTLTLLRRGLLTPSISDPWQAEGRIPRLGHKLVGRQVAESVLIRDGAEAQQLCRHIFIQLGCGCNCGCTLLHIGNVSSICECSSVRARLL